MVDVEDLIRAELAMIAPLTDDDRDWVDAVSRAKRLASSSPRRGLRRHRVVALAAIAFVVAAGTALALDLLGRKNVFFGASKQAPNLVKKQFLDLDIGAPRTMGPNVIAGQAREVSTFTIHGHRRKLWVAPTKPGGYCFVFEYGFGGCRRSAHDRGRKLSVTWMQAGGDRPQSVVSQIGGDITDARAEHLIVRYADGTKTQISFVWVSKPIDAGFFSFDIPLVHQKRSTRVTAVVLTGASGVELDRQEFNLAPPRAISTRPPVIPRKRPPRTLPSSPSPPPSTPIQRATADGVVVEAGRNGAVIFRMNGLLPSLRPIVSAGVSYTCFRLTREFGIFTVRGLGYPGALTSTVGLNYGGVGTPFDGCELQAQYGHRWPDAFGSHSVVEMPFTAKAHAFFADRAAARDLALFVRSKKMHELRRLQGAALRRGLQTTYGKALAKSAIRYQLTSSGARFDERSQTGKLFTVVVSRGRIAHQNLKPYAFVF